MLKTVVDIILYIVGAVIFLFYCNNAFNSTKSKYVKLLFVSLGFLVLYGIYQIGINYINGIAMFVVFFLLMHFVFEASVLSATIQSLLYIAFMIAGEYIVIPVSQYLYNLNGSDYHDNLHSYIFVVVASKLIHLVCLLLMLIVLKRITKNNDDDIKGFALILIIPISNIVFLTFIEYISIKVAFDEEFIIIWSIVALLMLLSNFLVFYNRSYILKQSRRINELNIERQKKELDEQYFSIIEKTNKDMQILAHDFNNHLSYINSIDSPEEIHSYINKISLNVDKFLATGISKNKTLDIIINKYTTLCDLKGIELIYDVKTSNLNQIDDSDLIALLNNLLDNAVEAAENSNKKRIEFVVLADTDFFDKIIITNSCDQKPLSDHRMLITVKDNKDLHGFGFKSVQKIVKKYRGDYYWEYDEENNTFLTSILIPKQ